MTDIDSVLNQRVGKIDTTQNKSFIFTVLRDSRFENVMMKVAQGAAQLNISNTDILDYEFSCPDLTEQEMVASLFQRMDSLITLHQRQSKNLELSLIERSSNYGIRQ